MVKQALRLAVLSAFAKARQNAHTAKPERFSTSWAFRMPRLYVRF